MDLMIFILILHIDLYIDPARWRILEREVLAGNDIMEWWITSFSCWDSSPQTRLDNDIESNQRLQMITEQSTIRPVALTPPYFVVNTNVVEPPQIMMIAT